MSPSRAKACHASSPSWLSESSLRSRSQWLGRRRRSQPACFCCLTQMSLRMERLGKAHEIERPHVNDTSPRAIDVCYEEERDRHNQRHDQEHHKLGASAANAITDKKVATEGDDQHQKPCRWRDAVPPCGLCVSLRIQHIVHP